MFFAVYINEIILTGDDLVKIAAMKSFMDDQFKTKDLGILHYFLGIELHYHSSGVLLHQKKVYL